MEDSLVKEAADKQAVAELIQQMLDVLKDSLPQDPLMMSLDAKD